LKELEGEGMTQRRVVASKSIESYYSLREKGREVTERLNEIRQLILTTHGFRFIQQYQRRRHLPSTSKIRLEDFSNIPIGAR